MSSVGNPYSEMLDLMRKQGSADNPPGIHIGTIKSVEPLLLEVGGVTLDEDFCCLVERLKPHKREFLEKQANYEIRFDYRPTIATYSMPSKIIGLTASSSATSKANVSGGDGTVAVSVNTSVNTSLAGDSHSHGSHNHVIDDGFRKVVGKGHILDGLIEFTDYGVKAGDTVVVLVTEDRQKYIILDKI